MGIGIEGGRMTRHEALTALRIRSASSEAADQHVAAAANEVAAVLEKHLSTLSNQ